MICIIDGAICVIEQAALAAASTNPMEALRALLLTREFCHDGYLCKARVPHPSSSKRPK
ncbi:MAG: hypothetical protein P4L71_15150 [Acetobacteraceae bacterium]|nr:hypothetical protein [Acetobacteraceae bacterium]